jgi:hypothetical protein
MLPGLRACSVVLLTGALSLSLACETERPPPPAGAPIVRPDDDEPPPFVIGDPVPGDLDAGCGGVRIPLVDSRPNFYFVIDTSGSMGTPIEGAPPDASTLYLAARAAIRDLLRVVGHRVYYGATVYPGTTPTWERPCPPGLEIFESRAGDHEPRALTGEDGPVLQGLMRVLGARVPEGTTPTGPTLRAVLPKLAALDRKTFVFLLTDGAPNCNEDATCTAETCEANLMGYCSPSVNCCESTPQYPLAHIGCIDQAGALEGVRDLARAGILTFVIGLPGTELFADLLDELALAGGTGRDRAPYFYAASRASELSEILIPLGAQVSIECDVELAEEPEAPGSVNVFFDDRIVHQGEVDGWRWKGPKAIELVGPACAELQSGSVLRLQVDVGCPTVVR